MRCQGIEPVPCATCTDDIDIRIGRVMLPSLRALNERRFWGVEPEAGKRHRGESSDLSYRLAIGGAPEDCVHDRPSSPISSPQTGFFPEDWGNLRSGKQSEPERHCAGG